MAATAIEVDGGKLQLVGSAGWEAERHSSVRAAKRALHMARTAGECQPFCTAHGVRPYARLTGHRWRKRVWPAGSRGIPQVFCPLRLPAAARIRCKGGQSRHTTRSCARPAVLSASEARMANFPTHIAVGTVVSGALATVTVAADMVAPENMVAVTLAGVLGSVLPDIDLKDSRPSRAMFAGLGVFFSFAVLFSLERKYSIAEMLILWLGTLVVRALRRQGDLLPLQLSPRHLAFAAGDGVLRLPHRLDLQQAARPQRRRGLACRRLHGHRLSHAPDRSTRSTPST